jgi:hypothetical protein
MPGTGGTPIASYSNIKEHTCYMRYICDNCNNCDKCDKLSEPLLKEQKGSEKKRSRNAACATLLFRGQSKHPTVMRPPLLLLFEEEEKRRTIAHL